MYYNFRNLIGEENLLTIKDLINKYTNEKKIL